MSPKFTSKPPPAEAPKTEEATVATGSSTPVEEAKTVLPEEELDVQRKFPDPEKGPMYTFHSKYDFRTKVDVAEGKGVNVKFEHMTFVLTPYTAYQLGTTVKELLGSPDSEWGLLGMSNHGSEFLLCDGPKVKHLPQMDVFKKAVEAKKAKTSKMVVGSRATRD